jgi:DDE family transposase
MYLTEIRFPSKNTTYRCILVRESYRQGGKVKDRTLANLSHGTPGGIEAIRLALAHKGDLRVLGSLPEAVEVGWLVYQVARGLGIERALGTQRAGKRALWQVMARVIDPGSRLSAVGLAQTHAGCDILGLQRGFDENDLYENLGWLAGQQRAIEKRLLAARGHKPMIFFYDVTSSYLEGECNELATWGYNRDKKAGKQQIVIGLLGDEAGEPVATEVFQGNTLDFATLGLQVKKIADVFGCQQVTLVGDRGMMKGGQIEELVQAGLHSITALTKGQIRALLQRRVLHLEAFGEPLREVTQAEIRYVVRRNPQRAAERAATRRAKQERLERELTKQNRYLAEHPRARVDTALRAVQDPLARLRLEKWLKGRVAGRQLQLEHDPAALGAESRLDGCYVLKRDLAPAVADLHTIHDRYKELTEVERASSDIIGRTPIPHLQDGTLGGSPGVCADRGKHAWPRAGGDAGLPDRALLAPGLGCTGRDRGGRCSPARDLVLAAGGD